MPIAGKRLSRSFRPILVVGKSPQFVLELIFCLNLPTCGGSSLIIGGTIFDKYEELKLFATLNIIFKTCISVLLDNESHSVSLYKS